MEEKEKSAKQETEVDIFRDTLLRYLGKYSLIYSGGIIFGIDS